MAKAPKTLSKAEIAAQKKDLLAAIKVVKTEHGKFVSDFKAAEKALATAKKETDKTLAAAQKVVDAAAAKLAKATEKAEAGEAKLQAKLEALAPAKAETAEA